jgi:multicomponent Na+:H+ antiporter subunit D
VREGAWLPLVALTSSLLPGIVIFLLGESRMRTRTILNMLGATVKLVAVVYMAWGVLAGRHYELAWELMPGLDFVLRVDPISLLFVSLSATLWWLTTIYAIGYLEGAPHRSRFFGFFSLCVTATVGIALAGNLFTFFIFYELLTVTTWPLVVHRGTQKAHAAGRVYLLYTLGGGVVLLAGVVWLHLLAGSVSFGEADLGPIVAAQPAAMTAIFWLLVAGLGVKAALVPLHGWLPEAMVAPAPVSALLHAVAVVKAGAYGIVRVVYDLYGLDLAAEMRLLTPLAVIASITIVYGSMQALRQAELKRRLAWSTVSQLSYIVLGSAMFGPLATTGGLVHLVHQGIMKITLFFCVGNLDATLHLRRVDELAGVGRRMPITMGAFTVAALGMIGVPPMAGFISKWYLGLGSLDAGQGWVLGILVTSSLLNAAYFLPLLHAAWFQGAHRRFPASARTGRLETSWSLLLPPVATAAITLGAGLLAASAISPLGLSRAIVAGLYEP